MTALILIAGATAYAQQADRKPVIDPPVNTIQADGTLRIRLNGAVTDWLLGANVAPDGAPAKVQVFEMDRSYKDERMKMLGQGFAKAVSYPMVNVLGNTVQINTGSHDTTAVYLEAPAWTTIIVTGPNDEVLYQTPLRKTLLVSRGVEFDGPKLGDFRIVLSPSDRTHEARFRLPPRATRYILQAKQ
jgi:hypothetical protein